MVINLRRIPVALGVWMSGILALVAAVTGSVVEHDGLTTVDRGWLDWFIAHRSSSLTSVATTISDLGGTVAMAALALVVCAGLLWLRHWRHLALVAVATVGAGALVTVVKHLVGRQRPPAADRLVTETNQSFPSGHSLGSMVVVGVVAIVATTWIGGRMARVAVRVAAGAAIVAVGLSRLYLGVHWPTDVLAGWSIGGLWLTICFACHRYLDLDFGPSKPEPIPAAVGSRP